MKDKKCEDVIITDAVKSDFTAIQEIYSYYVKNTVISFEEEVPCVEEMIKRWSNVVNKSLPYLVAKIGDKIVGYAYACEYRPRAAYRFTVEESVYVSKDYHGFGIGNKLLSHLIDRCREGGYCQMLAVIAGSENADSVKFHQKMGFRKSGVLEKFGFKFDKWIDTVLMQKEL